MLTSIVRRKFNEFGTLIDTHGIYPLVVRQLARDENVLFIDHLSKTEKIVEDLGDKASKTLYVWVAPGQYAKLPQGKTDDTHLSHKGADIFAQIVAAELANFDTLLKKFIRHH